jgi:hypothetical protein
MTHLSKLRDYFFTVALFLAGLLLSRQIDPSDIRDNGIFLWDSNYSFAIGKQLLAGLDGGDVDLSQIPQPFVARILFPLLAALLSKMLDLDFMSATYYLDLVSVLFASLLLIRLWRKAGISSRYSILGVGIYLFSWNFPLRFTQYWTGSGFAFQSLIAITTILSLQNLDTNRGRGKFSLTLFVIPLLSLGREFVLLIILSICLVKVLFACFEVKFRNRTLSAFSNYSYLRLCLVIFFSSGLYLFVRLLTDQPSQSIRSFLYFYFEIFWFHANIVESIYPYFLTMGWVLLVIAIVFFNKKNRDIFWAEIKNLSIQKELAILLVLLGFIFSLFGGLDSDRYLIWFFPIFVMPGLLALKVIINSSGRFISVRVFALGVVLILQSHIFLPGFPSVFAPNSSICNLYGLRTNYSSSAYRGIPLFSKLRQPMFSLSHAEAFASSDSRFTITRGTNNGPEVQIPESSKYCLDGNLVYKGAYKLGLNNVPFPIGYLHNQYEPWVWLPGYGDPKVKVMYLSQWFLIFCIFVRRDKRRRKV